MPRFSYMCIEHSHVLLYRSNYDTNMWLFDGLPKGDIVDDISKCNAWGSSHGDDVLELHLDFVLIINMAVSSYLFKYERYKILKL